MDPVTLVLRFPLTILLLTVCMWKVLSFVANPQAPSPREREREQRRAEGRCFFFSGKGEQGAGSGGFHLFQSNVLVVGKRTNDLLTNHVCVCVCFHPRSGVGMAFKSVGGNISVHFEDGEQV